MKQKEILLYGYRSVNETDIAGVDLGSAREKRFAKDI